MHILDNEAFQRQDLKGAYELLDLDPQQHGADIPLLRNSVRLGDHQIIAIAWMVEMEDGLPAGGLLADDCGTGKVSLQVYH